MEENMGGLIIFVIICFVGVIFCIWMITVSVKSQGQKKKLISASDGYYKSFNGTYTYEYMSKVFDENGNKYLKIVIQPTYGLDAFNGVTTNGWGFISFELTNNVTGYVQFSTFESNANSKYHPEFKIKLEPGMINPSGIVDIKVSTSSVWSVANNVIRENAVFNVKK